MSGGIVFQVETSRVLRILAREIYDSPLALLRENLQNAYDALRMRFAASGSLTEGGRIDITVGNGEIAVSDNGVGMTEEVLRENFWKAGSSGKHSDSARRAGVVGTFGIGAMANFGVCTRLTVETKAEGSDKVLRSIAERDSLKIAEECISLERIDSERGPGTTVTALLDAEHPISVDQARRYLEPYVALLQVPVHLNGALVSGQTVDSRLNTANRQFASLGSMALEGELCSATFEVRTDPNGQVLVFANAVRLGGNVIEGSMALLQAGGQLMGLRSHFGLAPVPAIGTYQFGGIADLSFLQPTAGREALSRESIDQVTRLITLAERAASELLAQTPLADRNNSFLQWILNHGRYELCGFVTIRTFPENTETALKEIEARIGTGTAHFYAGTDQHIISTFANEQAHLLQVVQNNPRRSVQLHFVQNVLHIAQVPDSATITKEYKGTELSAPEASVALRIASILRDDYLIPEVQVVLSDISHGVTVLPKQDGGQLTIYMARKSALLPPLFEFYDKAYDVFSQLMKDFVRVHVYARVQQFVPSSTRGGVDALRNHLLRNRELYRYEETERGDLEGILGEYLSGAATFNQVLRAAHTSARAHNQRVSPEQVGPVEDVVPEMVQSPIVQAAGAAIEFEPSPPIIRDDVESDMKILTTEQKYPQLNSFTMLLGLSNRLMRDEAPFFRIPHTTRILWGGHRVIYIFTEPTGRLSLYYDIELRGPLAQAATGGGMFPTTTLITKKRLFVPVPDALANEFKITGGAKEFYVRFDILSSDAT